jgi:hypothetical protein
MGKKYEAYEKAVKANNETKSTLQVAQGGSTAAHLQESQTNAIQAQINEDDTWRQVLEDPQG